MKTLAEILHGASPVDAGHQAVVAETGPLHNFRGADIENVFQRGPRTKPVDLAQGQDAGRRAEHEAGGGDQRGSTLRGHGHCFTSVVRQCDGGKKNQPPQRTLSITKGLAVKNFLRATLCLSRLIIFLPSSNRTAPVTSGSAARKSAPRRSAPFRRRRARRACSAE